MTEVSVIIPTYNRAEALRCALESALRQTFRNLEIVVVDDNSQDNTRQLVASVQDERVRYIRHDVNKKVSAARNTGILQARGKYIAFLDDDDEWFPEKLERQLQVFQHASPGVGGVYSGALTIERTSQKTLNHITPIKRGNVFEALLERNWIAPTSSVVLKRECFENAGLFDPAMSFSEDYDLWLRIAREYAFDYVEDPLVKYYVQDNGRLSNNYATMIAGLERLMKKHGQFFKLHRRSASHRHHTLGVIHCYSQNITKARKAFAQALCLYPYEPRHYVYFCLSLLGPRCLKAYTVARAQLSL
jgi:glycosyltransferase involved in cell wall biosynthesis